MRVLEKGAHATIQFAQKMEAAGVKLLTIHGRTAKQNKQFSGAADWDIIKLVNENVNIPVIANGGIEV